MSISKNELGVNPMEEYLKASMFHTALAVSTTLSRPVRRLLLLWALLFLLISRPPLRHHHHNTQFSSDNVIQARISDQLLTKGYDSDIPSSMKD